MMVKEIIVKVENKSGQLFHVVNTLSEANIDLKALTCSEEVDNKRNIKIITFDYDKAIETLKNANIEHQIEDIVITDVVDEPGGLAKILKIVKEAGVNIEYVYTSLTNLKFRALAIFKFDDNEKALKVLKENHITIVSDQNILDGNDKFYSERNAEEYLSTVITP